MESLDEQLRDILRTLLERGCELPFYWTMISANGGIVGGYYKEVEEGEGLDVEFLVSHEPDNFFELPINMMFVDKKGEAARVVIDKSGMWSLN